MVGAAEAAEAREEAEAEKVSAPTVAQACLTLVELCGFKCFRDRVLCGPFPAGGITAVVGPNGCGKSVVGEAVAFALGGNSKMLRAQNWGSLCSQYKAANAPDTKVTVTLEVQQGIQSMELKVERTITTSGTRTRVSLAEQGAPPNFKEFTQAELHALLIPFGLNTKAIDRYVVTQSRQAIEVHDPMRLLQHLECLLGTAALASDIEKQEVVAREAKNGIQHCDDEQERLQEVRVALAPELAKWRAYKQLLKELRTSRQQLLARKERLLQSKAELVQASADRLDFKHQDMQRVCQSSAEVLDGLLAEDKILDKQRKGLAAQIKTAHKQMEAAQADAANALAALTEAKEAAEAKSRLKSLAAKRTLALQAKTAAAQAAEGHAAAAVQALEGRIALLQQRKDQLLQEQAAMPDNVTAGMDQGAKPRRKQAPMVQEDRAQHASSVAAKLQAAEVAFKEAQRGNSRVHRELQLASAQLKFAQRAHDEQLAALREAEENGEAQSAAAAEAAAEADALQQQLCKAQEKLDAHRQVQLDAMMLLQRSEEALQVLASTRPEPKPPGSRQQAGGQSGHSGSSRWQAFDNTLLQLYQSNRGPQAGGQPGGLLGRLCNILRVTHPACVTAVNTVLSEVCNPATTLVSVDRATAYKTVAAFKHVGSVTCRVLDELPAVDTCQQPASAVELPGGASGVPLVTLVGGEPGAVPGAGRLVHSLFAGWALVQDKETALRVMSAQQQAGAGRTRWSLVTDAGQVFKADGEIVVPLGPSGRGPGPQSGEAAHALGSEVKPLLPENGTAAPGGVRRHDPQGDAAAAAALAALEAQQVAAGQEVERLRGRCATLEADATAAEAAMRRLAGQLNGAKARAKAAVKAGAAARSKVAAIRSDMVKGGNLPAPVSGDRGTGREERSGGDAGDQAGMAVSFLEALKEKVGWLEQQAQASKAELEGCAAALTKAKQEAGPTPNKGLSGGSGGAGDEDSPTDIAGVQRLLNATTRQLAKATNEHAACQRSTQHLQQQSREQADKAQDEKKQAGLSLTELKKAHAKLLVKAEKCEEAVESLEAQAEKLADQARTIQSSSTKAKERLEALQEQAAAAREDLGRLCREAARLKEAAEAVRGELRVVETDIEIHRQEEGEQGQGGGGETGVVAETAVEGGAGQQQQGERVTRQRAAAGTAVAKSKVVSLLSSSDSEKDSEESSEDCSPAPKQARRCSGARSKGLRAGDLVGEEAWVETTQCEVNARQAKADQLKMEINAAALQEDLDVLKAQEQVRVRMAEEQRRLQVAQEAVERLVDERYSLLSDALGTINAELSQVYRFLTGWLGDAYLQFTADRRLLFISGVSFNVRPDQHRWRPFASLSGGQQALSTLALAFAMQAAFPSPFSFFDEVDAALDTLNAERVADYMLLRSQGRKPQQPGTSSKHEEPDALDKGRPNKCLDGVITQYIVVSHRPQVFEKAVCLVGVYSYKGSSLAVTARM